MPVESNKNLAGVENELRCFRPNYLTRTALAGYPKPGGGTENRNDTEELWCAFVSQISRHNILMTTTVISSSSSGVISAPKVVASLMSAFTISSADVSAVN